MLSTTLSNTPGRLPLVSVKRNASRTPLRREIVNKELEALNQQVAELQKRIKNAEAEKELALGELKKRVKTLQDDNERLTSENIALQEQNNTLRTEFDKPDTDMQHIVLETPVKKIKRAATTALSPSYLTA